MHIKHHVGNFFHLFFLAAAAKHLYKDYESSKLFQKALNDDNSTTEEMDITVIETGLSNPSIAKV